MVDEQQSLYRPVIKREEINDSHFYYVDGEFFPSVTRILNYAPIEYGLIEFWKNNTKEDSDNILEMAGARGTAIHEACERLLQGGTIQLLKEFPKRDDQKVLVAFTNFVAKFQPKTTPGDIEITVASGKYKFAGTLDLHCEIDPKIIEDYCRATKQVIIKTDNPHWIIDFKTSSAVHSSYYLQILAYKQAYFEMTGLDCNVAILHLTPKTKEGFKLYTDIRIKGGAVTIDNYMDIYRTYLTYNGGKVEEPPKQEAYPETLSLTGNSNDEN